MLGLLLLAACANKFAPYLQKAQVAFAKKDYINTIDAVNAGLPVWRDNDGNDEKAEAFELLGKSYHQLRSTDKAIEAYTQAVALSNKTFDSAYALGILYLAKGQPKMAHKFFLDALRMKPDDALSLLGAGHSLYAQGDFSQASGYYQQVLDASPGVREALESLSLAKTKQSKSVKVLHLHKSAPAKKTDQRIRRSK